jgi:hypothetical protein
MIEDIGYVDENNIFHKNIIQPQNNFSNKHILSPQLQHQRKKISYDDLLSNMGIQLVNGKLELYNKNLIGQNSYPSKNPFKNANDYYYKMNRTNQNNIIQREPFQQQYQQPLQQQQYQQPLQQPLQQQQYQQPLSKEQYKQYLQFQYFKQQKERERINQIKSKKIQFNNPNASCQIRNNAPNLKLFRVVGQK